VRRGWLLLAAAIAGETAAQEAINTTAATQPGVGRTVLREQLHWYTGRQDVAGGRAETDELLLQTSLSAGIRHDLALGLDLPVSLRNTQFSPGTGMADDHGDVDAGDLRLLAKWRLHHADTGPLDTERASLLLGMQFDTGQGTSLHPDFARGSNDPIAGGVYTAVTGRHGFNAALEATISTSGDASDLRADGAWLYRLAPAGYAADTKAAWYVVAELNGRYQTNGDTELLFSPGLMYEARKWTLELSVRLPALQDLDHRPEIDLGVVLGVRLLF
jgi:hypothetical protein